MAPATVAQGIQLYVASLGGRPAGNEQQLVTLVRARLNHKFQEFQRIEVKQAALIYGLHPILQYLLLSVGQIQLYAMTRSDLGNAVDRIFELAAQRTKLRRKYGEVLEDDYNWSPICSEP